MKKILFFVLGLLIGSLTISAEHAVFAGVELGCNKSDFVNAMKQKGFTINNEDESSLMMVGGSFAGFHDCEIVIICTKSGKVAKVTVYLPKETSWISIKGQFNTIKDLYTNKYGNPEGDYHFFVSPYSEGDGYEMTAVKVEKCHYASFFKLDGYSIMVSISKYQQVKIVYEDNETLDILKNEIQKNVMQDI